MRKDVYLVRGEGSRSQDTRQLQEHIEAKANNDQFVKYTIGTICNYCPTMHEAVPRKQASPANENGNSTPAAAIPEAGTPEARRSEPDGGGAQIRKLTPRQINIAHVDKSPVARNNSVSAAVIPPTLEAPKARIQKREVHMVEDADEQEASPAKRPNTVVFSFPSAGKDKVSVHYADLKCLGRGVMLNDIIIDFYLRYILHELVPVERLVSTPKSSLFVELLITDGTRYTSLTPFSIRG